MALLLLSDRDCDDQTVAIISTKTSTRKEVQDILDTVKYDWVNNDSSDYLINNIIDALPDDCEVISYPDKVYY